MILWRILLLSLWILPSLADAGIEFSERESRKYFVLGLERPGNLTLELKREYQGHQYAELMFIYDEVRMRWEQTGDLIHLYRLPSYPKRGEEELAFVLRYEPEAQTLTFESKGILQDPRYFEFFADKTWQPASNRKDVGYRLYQASRKQPRSFFKLKREGHFPEDTPAVLMNLAARLFRDRVHELRVSLLYPDLDASTLRVVAASMFDETYDQNTLHRPLVAAHPNTPVDLRDQLFESTGYNKVEVWRAVAMREDEPEARYQSYLNRIKEGETNDRRMVAGDREAPREAWELAIAPRERDVLREFSRNSNAPADMIMDLFKSGALEHDAGGMAANKQTPPAVLDALSNTEDKQILWALQRNASTPEATIQKILAYFGNNESANLRGHAARDERTPVALLEKLARDVNVNVRTGVAMNAGAPLPVLEQLAEDSHQLPAERARDTIRRYHAAVYAAKQASWTPRDQLNPHNDLSQELIAAIKAGDQEAARKLIAFTDDPETRLKHVDILWAIQNYNFEGFKALFKETLMQQEAGARFNIFNRDQATAEQLSWAIDEGLLEADGIPRVLVNYSRKGRTDLILVLEAAGMLDSIDQQTATECLFLAVLTRNETLCKIWLSKGANSADKGREGLSSVDVAKRFYSLSILKLLDPQGRHADFVEAIRREFPIPENQAYVGAWTNGMDGFSESSMSFFDDGTGRLGATMVLLPFLWKEVGADRIELAMVDPESGELIEERLQLVLTQKPQENPNQKRTVLMLKAVDKDLTYFRIPAEEGLKKR